jgi:(2R)-ethylmalonyl-CoA mutase
MRLDDRPPWIIRTYAGFGDAEQSNQRFLENLARGQRGLSIAFDLPTQTGYDSDDPMARGEVGGTGVAIGHLGDMRRLLDEIDLGAINTSMTINATAPWLFALYIALADELGIARDRLRGTTQNDLLKEFVGRGTSIFAPAASLRLTTDLIVFSAEHVPNWNPINCCGYHYMESGAGPAEEIGFALGNALLILDSIRPRLSPEAFERVVKRISFFVNAGIELVPEISKLRAYSQLWTELCRDEYGIPGVTFRAGCQVRSLTLTEQQPEVNIVRIAYQALASVASASGRVRALQLPGFREAIALPDSSEQTLALRTQQVLMYETGLADHEDIFEGSHVVEAETARIKNAASQIAEQLRHVGYEAALEWISRRLTCALVEQQAALETGDTVRIGVNAFLDPVGATLPPKTDVDSSQRQAGAERQLERLDRWRLERDEGAVQLKLEALRQAAESDQNIMNPSIELARAGGTTGEWTQTLEQAFGGRFRAGLGLDVSVSRSPKVPRVDRPMRLLLAKGGLDGHVNAVKLLAFACREAGMEVIYTGLQQTPEAIAASALQEDVDLIGVSSLSGAHIFIAETVLSELAKAGSDIPVIVGGIIPEQDAEALKALGVAAVFTPKDGDIGQIVAAMIDVARR